VRPVLERPNGRPSLHELDFDGWPSAFPSSSRSSSATRADRRRACSRSASARRR